MDTKRNYLKTIARERGWKIWIPAWVSKHEVANVRLFCRVTHKLSTTVVARMLQFCGHYRRTGCVLRSGCCHSKWYKLVRRENWMPGLTFSPPRNEGSKCGKIWSPIEIQLSYNSDSIWINWLFSRVNHINCTITQSQFGTFDEVDHRRLPREILA